MPTASLINTTSGPYAIGDVIEIAISAEDFPDLIGIQTRVAYNSDTISFVGVDFAPELDLPFVGEEPAGGGDVAVTLAGGNSEGPAPSGDFVVATLRFEILAGVFGQHAALDERGIDRAIAEQLRVFQ